MDVIIVFWVNRENFLDVIKRNHDYSLEDQVRQYEKDYNYNRDSCYGIEKTVISQ